MSLLYDRLGAARTTGRRMSRGASAVIERFLKQVFGQVRIIDFSFPNWSFNGAASDVLFGIANPAEYGSATMAFFSRYRQAGGQLPILSLGPGSLDQIVREGADRVTVLYFETDVDPDLLHRVAGISNLALIVGMDVAAGDKQVPVLDGRRTIDLHVADAHDSIFRLALPDGEFAGLNALPGIDGPVEGARVPRRGVKRRPGELRGPVVLEPVNDPGVLSLTAARFIHDGGYRCEIDSGYSWLWSGPSPHLRLLVGGLFPASEKRQLKLTIANTNDPGNLEGIRIMIDGCIAPFSLEKWSATSGKVVVEVPDPPADFTVLSIGCPQMSNIDVNRQVGFCLDRLEVHP